jgi:hypothetical protein
LIRSFSKGFYLRSRGSVIGGDLCWIQMAGETSARWNTKTFARIHRTLTRRHRDQDAPKK